MDKFFCFDFLVDGQFALPSLRELPVDKLLCIECLDCIDRESRRGGGDSALCICGILTQAVTVTYALLSILSAQPVVGWTPGCFEKVDAEPNQPRLVPHPLFLCLATTLCCSCVIFLHVIRNLRLKEDERKARARDVAATSRKDYTERCRTNGAREGSGGSGSGQAESGVQHQHEVAERGTSTSMRGAGDAATNFAGGLHALQQENMASTSCTLPADREDGVTVTCTSSSGGPNARKRPPDQHQQYNADHDQLLPEGGQHPQTATLRDFSRIFAGAFLGSAFFCVLLDPYIAFAYPTLAIFAGGSGVMAYLQVLPSARDGVGRDMMLGSAVRVHTTPSSSRSGGSAVGAKKAALEV